MNKKDMFIKVVEEMLNTYKSSVDLKAAASFTDEEFDTTLVYLEALKVSKSEKSKEKFTDNGKLILTFMRDNVDSTNNLFKAKDIAEGIFVSSRSVSGAIRKLVNDGYVEKTGQDPIIYSVTPLGKEVEIS